MSEGDKMLAAACLMARVAQCLCEMEAMFVANVERNNHGLAPAYAEDAFRELPTRIGCDSNQAIEILRGEHR